VGVKGYRSDESAEVYEALVGRTAPERALVHHYK
jgi:hypothetical protein